MRKRQACKHSEFLSKYEDCQAEEGLKEGAFWTTFEMAPERVMAMFSKVLISDGMFRDRLSAIFSLFIETPPHTHTHTPTPPHLHAHSRGHGDGLEQAKRN